MLTRGRVGAEAAEGVEPAESLIANWAWVSRCWGWDLRWVGREEKCEVVLLETRDSGFQEKWVGSFHLVYGGLEGC